MLTENITYTLNCIYSKKNIFLFIQIFVLATVLEKKKFYIKLL